MSRGGEDTWENLVCACVQCNNRKGDRTPEEAGMPLRRCPRRPNHVTFIRHVVGTLDERWKPYLFLN
jgi:5-methylcytosine-specific restriction endonuclease McrA